MHLIISTGRNNTVKRGKLTQNDLHEPGVPLRLASEASGECAIVVWVCI